jgi:hypothetical protein
MGFDIEARFKDHQSFLAKLRSEQSDKAATPTTNPAAANAALKARAEAVDKVWQELENVIREVSQRMNNDPAQIAKEVLWYDLRKAPESLRNDLLDMKLLRDLPEILDSKPDAPSINFIGRTRILARTLEANAKEAEKWPQTKEILEEFRAQDRGQLR